jgi:Tol biopolymer transport system component
VSAGILALPVGVSALELAQEQVDGQHRVTALLSPDGQRIAYGQVAVRANGQQDVRIIVGGVDGGDRRALPLDATSIDEVRWVGNDKIAYVTDHGQDGYFLMDLSGQSAGRLNMPAGCDSFFHQCLSPDGRRIAYCGNYAEIPADAPIDRALPDSRRRYFKEHPQLKQQHGLFVANLQQQTIKHLLDETIANLPAWSADSRKLAAGIGHYVSSYPLVIIDVETGEVTRPNVKGVGVAWSPDGSALAMTTDVVRGGSWRSGIPLDGALGVWNIAEQQRVLVSPPGKNISIKEPYSWTLAGSHNPVWSSDGQWIAYQRTESDKGKGGNKVRQEVWIVDRAGGKARKALPHGASHLAWTLDSKNLLWVHEGRFGSVNLEIDAAAVGPTPAAPEGRFAIYGRIVDARGMPLDAVEVTVARGMGTLKVSAPVKSDADGWYEIHFGPGIWSEGANAQYACVCARKTGMYEKDLCRAGNLGMANFKPADFEPQDWGVTGMVYPGHLYRLDFTMLPSASLSVELVDRSGQPLANYRVHLDGDKLYPASSVLQSGATDGQGRATFGNVPLKEYYISIEARRAEYKTEPLAFDRAEPVHLRLVYDDLAGTLTAQRR